MTVFLIVIAVLAVITAMILSLSATLTVVYDNGWHTKIKVVFFEKEIVLSQLLSFILFPQKKADEVSESNRKNKEKKKKEKERDTVKIKPEEQNKSALKNDVRVSDADSEKSKAKEQSKPSEEKPVQQKKSKPKENPISKLWKNEGIVGILNFVSNLLDTANSAVLTLIRGLHIYSLYVMIIVGGGDADRIARSYGEICRYYFPVKGMILNAMRVDYFDDYIQPDFIAERTEFQLQFIGSISVGLLLKVVLKAGFVFLKNLIKNK